ncbi:MAG TPA: DoxX family protein [Thermoanaerobaculia bacterium]|nr:DoxX family protein [Thermoanaerobaculia bacterium]
MKTVLSRFSPQFFALLRIMSGVMFAMHGTQKLFGWPGNQQPMGMALMKVAGAIELVAGVLIAIGLLTGIAAFIASGEMAAAFFMGHAKGGVLLPILNQGELAVLYCFLFLFIAAHGAGIWSVDGTTARR